jgi:hypothetical protein
MPMLNFDAFTATTLPEHPSLKKHPMSVGACDLDWREETDAGRLVLMQRYFTQMVHRDFLEESVVRAALDNIDEFKGYPFSSDPPQQDDEEV